MARLDKQLDKLSGEKLVRLHWPEDHSIDIELLRADLVREINEHDHRVPLDLRSVKDAPQDLVELLVDMERYAKSKAKTLSMTWILPPLRDAIDERTGRRSAPSSKREHDVASKTAREILNGNETKAEYSIQTAKRVDRKKQPQKRKLNFRYLQLGVITLIGASIVIAVMFFFLWQSQPIVIDTDKIYE